MDDVVVVLKQDPKYGWICVDSEDKIVAKNMNRNLCILEAQRKGLEVKQTFEVRSRPRKNPKYDPRKDLVEE